MPAVRCEAATLLARPRKLPQKSWDLAVHATRYELSRGALRTTTIWIALSPMMCLRLRKRPPTEAAQV